MLWDREEGMWGRGSRRLVKHYQPRTHVSRLQAHACPSGLGPAQLGSGSASAGQSLRGICFMESLTQTSQSRCADGLNKVKPPRRAGTWHRLEVNCQNEKCDHETEEENDLILMGSSVWTSM